MIDRAFRTIGVEGVRIHFAHRGVFNALLDSLAITEGADEVLRIVDKLRKIGEQKVRDQLTELVGAGPAEKVLALVSAAGTNAEILSAMRSLVPGAAEHTDRIEQILFLTPSRPFSSTCRRSVRSVRVDDTTISPGSTRRSSFRGSARQ